jgi:hypothetical protein
MASNAPPSKGSASAASAPPGAGVAGDELKPLPSRSSRLLTPGTGLAFVGALVFVYYAWGMAFEPGGTGSNVVLGLLMALALIYLIMANLGPFIDQAFFTRGDPRVREKLRELVLAIEDFERLAASASKGKEKRVDEAGATRLREEAVRMRGAWTRSRRPCRTRRRSPTASSAPIPPGGSASCARSRSRLPSRSRYARSSSSRSRSRRAP